MASFAIESNNIGPVGAKAIAEALDVKHRVCHLNIGKNNIGAQGAKDIIEVFAKNKEPSQLYLGTSYRLNKRRPERHSGGRRTTHRCGFKKHNFAHTFKSW
jgi:hypothetical protein